MQSQDTATIPETCKNCPCLRFLGYVDLDHKKQGYDINLNSDVPKSAIQQLIVNAIRAQTFIYLNNKSYNSSTRFCSTCKCPSSGWSNSTFQIPDIGRFPAENSHLQGFCLFCLLYGRLSLSLRIFDALSGVLWCL